MITFKQMMLNEGLDTRGAIRKALENAGFGGVKVEPAQYDKTEFWVLKLETTKPEADGIAKDLKSIHKRFDTVVVTSGKTTKIELKLG